MRRYGDCLRLNLRMLGHVLARRWLTPQDVAAGYDRLAHDYDANWLCRLIPVTDRLIAALPDDISGAVFDLGCGTGYLTAALVQRYPAADVTGVDISPQMVAEARRRGLCATLKTADMLSFLRRKPDGAAALIVSAWAIGYSVPDRLIAAAARVLAPGGMLVFTVNYADTLAPVFRAYRRCLAAYPDKVRKALWPRFPRDRATVEKMLRRHGLRPELVEEGCIAVAPPESGAPPSLAWLLKTGVLAGFDAVLPLPEDPELAARFEEELAADSRPLEHHFITIKGVRPR